MSKQPNQEVKGFFLKMLGDFNKYIAEFSQANILTQSKESALNYYL